jgi:hypothetical protein
MLGARQLDLTNTFAPEGITEAGLGAVGFERAGPRKPSGRRMTSCKAQRLDVGASRGLRATPVLEALCALTRETRTVWREQRALAPFREIVGALAVRMAWFSWMYGTPAFVGHDRSSRPRALPLAAKVATRRPVMRA